MMRPANTGVPLYRLISTKQATRISPMPRVQGALPKDAGKKNAFLGYREIFRQQVAQPTNVQIAVEIP
jgi:hypothetical protein